MDFQKNVLDASKNLPVVVDFWAPWCGPCRILGPVIEQLASEQEGKWKLVKLNTEEYPEIAAQYGIRSIPNVKMFYNGDIIAEFAGALPRHSILKWLEDYLPTEDKKELTILLEELENADDENSIQLLEEFVSAHPNVEEGRGLLAKSIVLKDPARAAELVSDIKIGHAMADEAEDIRTLAELSSQVDSDNGEVGEILNEVVIALNADDQDTALAKLIEAVQKDKNYANELPRRASIAMFHLLGPQHPLTKKYRRIFDMALY